MRDAGVGGGAVEPDSLHGWAETVFAEFVGFCAVGYLGHVGVLHWEDGVGGDGLGVCERHDRTVVWVYGEVQRIRQG